VSIGFGVDVCKVLPFLGQVIGSIDCGHGACWYAGAAVDTFHWINVKLWLGLKRRFVLPRVNAIHGAGIYTSSNLSFRYRAQQ
jgi:hypothetical protein